MRNLVFLFLLITLIFSCKNEPKKVVEEVKEKVHSPVAKYNLTPFQASQAYPDAKIESMFYKDGSFNFDVRGEAYKLGAQTPDAAAKMCANSGKGQHIHLIVDNSPYAAKYVPTFEHEVQNGEHLLLAFLSRSYHESIKTLDAYIGLKATFENGTMTNSNPITMPTLFYSRPKGTYVGKADTEKVMLDFYLLNADLGNDYTIDVDINGEVHTITKWQPYYIEGLPMGENTVKLTFKDKAGKIVDSPINPVSRTFTLKADPAEAG